ncbi:hypothetical protein YC2023_118885 [Brassica napus]
MAPGRVPSVGLVPDRQFGNSSDDEPEGCAQSGEGSSFHRLGDSPSGIEYSKWLSLPQGPYTDSYFLRDLGGGGGGLEIIWPDVMDDLSLRRVPPFWKDQDVIMDLGLLGREDWSPEWSFMGETRYLNSLLDTPYLAGIFWVPRYLTTRGDSAYRLSPFLSWGMMLLWDKPAGARKFSTGPWP